MMKDDLGLHARLPVAIGTSRAQRSRARADLHRESVLEIERRALAGDRYLTRVPWVRGHLYLWWMPEIEQLVREERLVEALNLAWECMEAAERDHPPVPSGWAWKVAVIARRLRRFELEVEVVERYLHARGPNPQSDERWMKRRASAQALLARSRQE